MRHRRKIFHGEEVELHYNYASKSWNWTQGISVNLNKGSLWLFSVFGFHVPQKCLDSSPVSGIFSSLLLSTLPLHDSKLWPGYDPTEPSFSSWSLLRHSVSFNSSCMIVALVLHSKNLIGRAYCTRPHGKDLESLQIICLLLIYLPGTQARRVKL